MGGNIIEDDWDFPCLSNGARTVLLVGRVGNGKSATGNSIIGRKAFKSSAGGSSVTSTIEMQSTVLADGQVMNVIDTIGLFDCCLESEIIGKEIVKCIDLAKDGIHAILLVLSVRTRFSKEETTALQILQYLFGPKINDYMIVVFTGGDELEENDQTFEDYLDRCPEPLKNILTVCNNRRVLFDNKSKDRAVTENQRQNLLILIEKVMAENGGLPYTAGIFKELKKGAMKLRQQEIEVESLQGYTKEQLSHMKEDMLRSHDDELLRQINEMVDLKLAETNKMLKEQLAVEHEARLKAEEMAQSALGKSNDEIRKLRENLEKAQRETEELRKAAESGKCSIL